MTGKILLSEEFGTFLEILELNLNAELSSSSGVSVTTSKFGGDLSMLVNALKDVIFKFFFGVSTLTGISTFTSEIYLLLELM